MNAKKIVVTASAATLCAGCVAVAAVVICRRLFEKKYVAVGDGYNCR